MTFSGNLQGRRCVGHCRNGTRCSRRSVIGTPYCYQHLKSDCHLRIKLFYFNTESNQYVDRGIGNLHIKLPSDGAKKQMIIRAEKVMRVMRAENFTLQKCTRMEESKIGFSTENSCHIFCCIIIHEGRPCSSW